MIHTKKPDPLLPARLAFYGGQIVPKKYLEQVGPDTFNAKPVGTGAVGSSRGRRTTRRSSRRTRTTGAARSTSTGSSSGRSRRTPPRVAALLKGEIDAMVLLPPDHFDRVNQNATTRASGALYAGLYVLAVNSKVPPLNNPLVKQAMSLAIDREAIVKELWRGRGIVPNGPIAQGDNHYDASLPPLAYDPKEAKERLKKAGYKNEPINIETTVGYMANDKAMSEAIAAMWKDVGLNAVVEVVEYSVRAQKNREQDVQGALVVRPDLDPARPRRHDVAAARLRAARRTTGGTRSSTSWATPRASRSTRSSAARRTAR